MPVWSLFNYGLIWSNNYCPLTTSSKKLLDVGGSGDNYFLLLRLGNDSLFSYLECILGIYSLILA